MLTHLPDLPIAVESLEALYLYHLGTEVPQGSTYEVELKRRKYFINRLTSTVAGRYGLHASGFVLVKAIQEKEWSQLLPQFARFWRVETGMTVRPGREAFRIPVYSAMLGQTAGTSGALEMVYRITPDPNLERLYPGTPSPGWVDAYLGSGGCLTFLTRNTSEFLASARQQFDPERDPALDALDFSVPVFETNDFLNAGRLELTRWFSFFDIYIAEVTDDPGILIASRYNLDQLIGELSETVSAGQWE